MCLQEAMRVTGRDRKTETEATEEQHRHLPPLEASTGCERRNARAADRVEFLATEDFHGAQSILLPGRRTYEEGNDPEEEKEDHHHDPALPREEPPEREGADFNIPGLPHSTVKQLQGANVHNLIQKIENHPHRRALQRDLQQSQSFNPFSQQSKVMIRDVGNIELCELLETEPKNAVQSVFIILGHWHRLLHVRALLA